MTWITCSEATVALCTARLTSSGLEAAPAPFCAMMLADLGAEMQTLADMIASGMPGEVIAQQKKTIVQLAFPALPQDDMADLLTAID